MGAVSNVDTPAAGHYDQAQSFVKRSLLGGSFGKADRMGRNDFRSVPGPGAYNMRKNVDFNTGKTVGGK
jgi:hypothetical protein